MQSFLRVSTLPRRIVFSPLTSLIPFYFRPQISVLYTITAKTCLCSVLRSITSYKIIWRSSNLKQQRRQAAVFLTEYSWRGCSGRRRVFVAERKSECGQMLRVCSGFTLCRNASSAHQSPTRILRGFSTDTLTRNLIVSTQQHIPVSLKVINRPHHLKVFATYIFTPL